MIVFIKFLIKLPAYLFLQVVLIFLSPVIAIVLLFDRPNFIYIEGINTPIEPGVKSMKVWGVEILMHTFVMPYNIIWGY